MKALNSTSEIVIHLVGRLMNLGCFIFGIGLLIFSPWMVVDYPGEQHNMQVIGILLIILGGQK